MQSIDTYVVKPAAAYKRVKARLSRPRDLAALMALAEWREQWAQNNDQPRGRILKDDAIARSWPSSARSRPLTSISSGRCPGVLGAQPWAPRSSL